MKTVGSYQAKTHLPRLLRQVARGEEITITKHGAPVAVLAPAPSRPRKGQASLPLGMSRRRSRPGAEPGDCIREMQWLAGHREEYAGQWVALDGNRLLAHGTSAPEVYAKARKSGVRLPLVVQVEPAHQTPFGGW